jgi:alpha-glucosidase
MNFSLSNRSANSSAPILRCALGCLLAVAACQIAPAQEARPTPSSAVSSQAASNNIWWKHGVIYEIYPRSFQDTNGDGTGDVKGITKRLDYLQHLGVDAIWIAPMFPSPQVDFGYDISDYRAVDPQYGTLADMDTLIAEAKKHNIRILLDMVLNHTSDKDPWFEQSALSRTNPRSDWYMWADGVGPNKDQVPNNWESLFGHSAWTWVPARKQFYYHKFYAQQPDLNWRNPAVEKAMFDVLRFWLDRGVAGFRLDAIPTLFENPDMKDEAPILDAQGNTSKNAFGDIRLNDTQTNNLPEIHDVLRRMRKLVDSYPGNRVLVGETYVSKVSELDAMYGGAAQDELQLPMDMQVGMTNKLDPTTFRRLIQDADTGVHGGQPLFVFDNHDNPRADRYCTASAAGQEYAPDSPQCLKIQKLLATLLFTSRSTALMYYGDEIGMKTTPPTRKEDVKDPIGITGWPLEKGRDGDRTPMQWTPGPNAGFTAPGAKPWLPIPPSYKIINVQVEKPQADSMLNWYTHLIALRRSKPALRNGKLNFIDTSNTSVLAYSRKLAGAGTVYVVVNMSSSPQAVMVGATSELRTILSDAPGLAAGRDVQRLKLPGYSSWVGETR